MSLRFACVAALTLTASSALAQHSEPVFLSEGGGISCFPYNECSSPTMCEGPGIDVCSPIVTGEHACVPSTNTRYNTVCCAMSEDCIDALGVQGTCHTVNPPQGEAFGVCVWNTPRSFLFCQASIGDISFADIQACGGTVTSPGNHTLAQKLLAGDCDGDMVLNENDVCPCEFAPPSATDGCPVVIDDGGVSDASTDSSVPTDGSSGDSGSTPDGTTDESGLQFGGGGGCEGCAAGGDARGDLALAALVLAALFARRRAR